jgi:signal transduction histidine kinase
MSFRWRRRFRSIRTRIVVGYVVLLAVALIVTIVILRAALLANFSNNVDTRLASEVEQLQVVIAEGDPDTGEPFTDAERLFSVHLRRVLPADDDAFYTLVDGRPFEFTFGASAALLADPEVVERWSAITSSQFGDLSTEAGVARTLAIPVTLDDSTGTFVVAAFIDGDRGDLTDIFRTIMAVGFIVLLASAFVAAAIARRISRPVVDLTSVVRSIDDSDLSTRIPVNGVDEMAELSLTFNAMMDRLDASFRSQREFLDDVAHELRTPITIIQGHLDVMGDDRDERRKAVELVTDELDRMSRYIDELLVLAQSERPDFVRLESVDLDEFAHATMARLTALANRRWMLVTCPPIEGKALGSATFDPHRITQALLNLAQNAVRHTRDDDEVEVTVRRRADSVEVTVRDTGTGVDPAVVADLLVRHVRSAESRRSGGVGLGLSIVDAIVSAHGGGVSVRSPVDPGRADRPGAAFTFTIPQPTTIESKRIGDDDRDVNQGNVRLAVAGQTEGTAS